MGKIVKYCNSCDEGFAEKFTFCPDCGQTLQAFEMNPVQAAVEAPAIPAAPVFTDPVEENVEAAADVETAAEEVEASAAEDVEAAPIEEVPAVIEEPAIEASASDMEDITAAEPEPFDDEPEEVTVIRPQPIFTQSMPMDADRVPTSLEAEHEKAHAEGNYYLTVLEEKNLKQRNGLLMGTFGFMIFAVIFGVAYSIFSRDLEVAAINDNFFNALLIDDVPMPTEEEEKLNKDKDAGGGGGGGREQEETTQGDLANQTKNPERPPEALPRIDTSMPLPAASTQGNKTFEQTHDRYGDPNGRFSNWNNGPGTGGGQGTGTGTGQGSGRGTGAGSGTGSGYGSGIGDGNGSGTGSGDDGSGGPPARPVGVTSAIKILSKPRPGYTDSARQANIQGTVILRVTFLANGSIGGVSAVKGLPNGLTEQAIAAARRIAFEPAKVNGVPQNSTKQIEYSFSIY